MKIEITNGYAEISEEWKWKHEEKYAPFLYDAAGGGDIGGSFIKAKSTMVRELLTNLVIGGKEVGIDGIGEISAADFEKIYKACVEIRNASKPPSDEEKKS